MKTRVIEISSQGDPSVMELVTAEILPPGPNQVLVRQKAIGLNYLDVYHRSGEYPPCGAERHRSGSGGNR